MSASLVLNGIIECSSLGGRGGGSLHGDDGDFVVCESCEDGAHMSGKLRDECCKQKDVVY